MSAEVASLTAPPAPSPLHDEVDRVLRYDAAPRNAFEVAVALEVSGYTAEQVRSRGYANLFALAHAVHEALVSTAPDLGPAGSHAEPVSERHWPTPAMLVRGILHSAPWIGALLALVLGRVSFWSTIVPAQFSSAISLALYASLILTGAVVQAFARRAVFYALQGSRPLTWWATRWTLLGGGCVIALLFVLAYVALNATAGLTPNANRTFLYFGLAMTALFLSLAPLYTARAFGWLAVASTAGVSFLVVAARITTHGNYLNPYLAMQLGLVGIGVVVAIALPAGLVQLNRMVAVIPNGVASGRVRPPRLSVVAASVAPYALYGAGFFALLSADQLVAGGIWRGHYSYASAYELIVATALLVLIPTLAYCVAIHELLPSTLRTGLRTYAIAEASRFREDMNRFYRRHLTALLLVGSCAGLLLGLCASLGVGQSLLAAPGTDGLTLGPLVTAMAAYLCLAVGAFNSGLLFSLARPAVPAGITVLGTVASLLLGGLVGALGGLLGGCLLFAGATTWRARRAFDDIDGTYFGSF